MTDNRKRNLAATLEETEIYLVETDEPASLIGEYAGVDEQGRLMFTARTWTLAVPPDAIVDTVRLS